MSKSIHTFKKDEYIQLHKLGSVIRDYWEEKHDINLSLEDYEELGVEPHHVHLGKENQEKAVQHIFSDIAKSLNREYEEDPEKLLERLADENSESSYGKISGEERVSPDLSSLEYRILASNFEGVDMKIKESGSSECTEAKKYLDINQELLLSKR